VVLLNLAALIPDLVQLLHRILQQDLRNYNHQPHNYPNFQPNKVELIVGYKQKSILSSEQKETLDNDLGEIKLEAQSRDISVLHTDNTKKAAKHIYQCALG
jgi:hypothetical protein